MPRKKQTIHASGLVEVKATIGKTFDGKRIQKSFYGSSKLEAQRKADEYKLEQQVANKIGDVFIKKEYTFGEWAMKWLETYKKPNVSENTYRFTYENTVNKHLIPFFKSAMLTDIHNVDIQSFFATKTEMSQSMLGKMLNCLIAIFDTAIENDLCYKNPCKKIVLTTTAEKTAKQTYTSAEIDMVKNACSGKMNEIILLLEAGLRRGEMLGIMWSDIDFANGLLTVNRSIADSKLNRIVVNPPKWNSYRTIPLPEQSLNILRNTIRRNEYIFPNDENQIQSPNSWSQRLTRFMETLPPNIPRLTAHELRHTYGTDLRRKGIDIYTIQKVMGHKDIKMTSELYVHNEVEELKKAMENAL